MVNLGLDKIYVLNLPRRYDRRERFDKLFEGLDFHYINAISGGDLNIKELINQKHLNPYFLDPDGAVNKNIIGCSLSHFKCWETFSSTKLDTCLILEDDVYTTDELIKGDSTSDYWNDIKSEIDELDWDIIFLGKKTKEVECESVSSLFCETSYGEGLFGAHSYMVNKKSVKVLMEKYKPITYAVDVFLDLMEELNIFTLKKSFFRQRTDIYLHDKNQPKKVDSDTRSVGKYKTIKVDESVHSVEMVNHTDGLVKLNFK